ncbi:xaa-Arg dipeptidase-like [Clytia hemisphaerica]|uniref:Peptidase M20 domain-containing protein 2 n=1 Tax=Clytia hemisphaerica TaxID=252671 RepID=A0A7M5XFM4_9CNID
MKEQLKQIICEAIDSKKDELNNISQEIWKNPELSFEEFKAHNFLTEFLEKEGFSVSRKTPLETSFIAKYGDCTRGIKVGVICEYDALPGVGHACGHNLIAEAGIGAALGLKAAMDSNKDLKMNLIVYGTPAEEGGNGKCLMIEKGVFDEADICMMSHPAPYEIPNPLWLAIDSYRVIFKGKTAHAAAAPWEGINALDAAVACYNNVSMLRQQMKPTNRIQCTIVDGGERPNIIPERAEMVWDLRTQKDEDLTILLKQWMECAKGAAKSTGCEVEFIKDCLTCLSLNTNQVMIDLYMENAKSLGVPFEDDHMRELLQASTDMGNVSAMKPSIHPCFKIKSEETNHNHGFTKAAGSEESQLPTLNSAKSMAMTAIDIVCEEGLLEKVQKSFEDSKPSAL